jgi:CRISPR-associated endoribonuclease Cas6
MRVRIIFGLKNKGAVLPFHHQKLISILVREVMGSNDPHLEQFNFSGLKGQTKVVREGLSYFSKRVTIVFSSMNEKIIRSFIEKIFILPTVKLGNLLLEPEYAEEELPPLMTSSCKYLCISPLVLFNFKDNQRNKRFISPVSDEFSDLLYESTMHRMEKSGLYTSEEITTFNKFQIVPDKDYLDKIAKEEKKFARIYTLNEELEVKEVRGYTFPFSLYASPKVQEFIYHNGFGELTYVGFGMLDFHEKETIQRKVIIEKNLVTAQAS